MIIIHTLLGRKRGNPAGEHAPGEPASKESSSGKRKKTKPRWPCTTRNIQA